MPDPDQFCNWCNRPRNEVRALIPSPSNSKVLICDGCVEKCHTLLANQPKPAEEAWRLPKPRELQTLLDEYVVGQQAAKEVVSAAIYKHYKRRFAGGMHQDVEITKDNTLIIGPSGCGKTQILRVLARILKVPYFVQDATRLTQAGYVGEDVEMMLQGLLENCSWDVEKAQWGIIGIDEVDKLSRKSGREVSGYRDVNGEGVQQALLKIVEGGEHIIPVGLGTRLLDGKQQTLKLDTTNILFFGMGSFAGINQIIERRLNKAKRVGFGNPDKRSLESKDYLKELDEDDILEFGVIPEFAGRFPVLTGVLPLTEDELVQILTEPKDALVKQQKALYALDHVELEYEDAALRAIAKKASSKETGARALKKIMAAAMLPYDLAVPDDPTIRKVIITKDVVEGRSPAIIVRDPSPKLAQA